MGMETWCMRDTTVKLCLRHSEVALSRSEVATIGCSEVLLRKVKFVPSEVFRSAQSEVCPMGK